MNYHTIQTRIQGVICFIKLNRPNDNNTINRLLIEELHQVLDQCKGSVSIIVLEGLPGVFCFGADFGEMLNSVDEDQNIDHNPEKLYDLWFKLATGPYVTIAHVCGKTNAGGVGFVAACDIVLADLTAQFSLSELLFGIFPACVFPFLVRRIGLQNAHYMTLMTKSIGVEQAYAYGLVDAWEEQSDKLLRKHLLRLKNLTPNSVGAYKKYINKLNQDLFESKMYAVETNKKLFSDIHNTSNIRKFLETGELPLRT